MLFAIVLFAVSYFPFVTAMEMLRKFYDLRDNPLHYSLFTMIVATMWDTVVCMLAFKMAFSDQV